MIESETDNIELEKEIELCNMKLRSGMRFWMKKAI